MRRLAKAVLFIFAVSISVPGYSQNPCGAASDGWKPLELDSDTLNWWTSAVGVDPRNPEIILAGIGNNLFKTRNCGQSWSRIQGKPFTDIRFNPVVSDTVYLSTRDNIYKSSDRGSTIRTASRGVSIPPNTRLSDIEIHPVESHKLYAASEGFGGGAVFATDNGGDNWSKLLPESAYNFNAYDVEVYRQNPDTVFAAADQLFRSFDGGASWDTTSPFSDTLSLSARSLQFIPESERLYVWTTRFSDVEVYYTTDFGQTWEATQAPDILQFLQNLFYVPTGPGQYQLWGKTIDKIYTYKPDGDTWDKLDTGGLPSSEIEFMNVDTASGNVYVGIASEGIFVRNFKTATSNPSVGSAELPDNFGLKNNYPNPFNPTTNIRFQLPEASHVQVSVYNAVGQKVATLVDRPMNAGTHSVVFNAGGLTSGVYIYRLEAGEFRESGKMLLLE